MEVKAVCRKGIVRMKSFIITLGALVIWVALLAPHVPAQRASPDNTHRASPDNTQRATPNITRLEAVSVSMSTASYGGKSAIRLTKDPAISEVDEPTFAKLKDVNFRNGSIEVKVRSRLLPNAPESARGFIGVAFRIDERNSKFECLYLRPTNGRAEVQLRRNRKFGFSDRLRVRFRAGFRTV